MELWIRSQDKKSLVKIDNVYISIGNSICYYVEKGKELPGTYFRPAGELGKYKTEERALEILDIIQTLLTYSTSTVGQLRDAFKYYKELPKVSINSIGVVVYEMPEQ